MSDLPQAVMVHSLTQLQTACASGMAFTALSAPGAALSWGGLWWQALLNAASYTGPALLDCATAPGRAVEALELGLSGIILAPCPAWAEIAALAATKNALLLPAMPDFLDLGEKGNQRHLLGWLSR